MEDYKIIVNKDIRLIYCDIKVDGILYIALASQIINRRFVDDLFNEIFTIQLIYSTYNKSVVVAEYEFIYDRNHGMELENFNFNKSAIDIIVSKHGARTYTFPDRNTISKELVLRIYNEFREVFIIRK